MLMLASAFNVGDWSRYITRFVSESYGLLIAMLLFSQGIKGIAEEFAYSGKKHNASTEVDRAWSLVNGLWSIILSLSLLTLALLLSQARHTSFFRYNFREFLSAFGAPLSAVAVTLLSYAIRSTPGQIPVRTMNSMVYDEEVTDNWRVGSAMDNIQSSLIAQAIIPAIILTLLALLNQLVVARLTQQEDFGVRKPFTYSFDLLLLSMFFAIQAVTGLVPATAVLPQSPLHTKVLMNLRPSKSTISGMSKRLVENVKSASKSAGKSFRRATGLKKKSSGSSKRKHNKCVLLFPSKIAISHDKSLHVQC